MKGGGRKGGHRRAKGGEGGANRGAEWERDKRGEGEKRWEIKGGGGAKGGEKGEER